MIGGRLCQVNYVHNGKLIMCGDSVVTKPGAIQESIIIELYRTNKRR